MGRFRVYSQGSGAGTGGWTAWGVNKRRDLRNSPRASQPEQRGTFPGLGRLGEGGNETGSGWGKQGIKSSSGRVTFEMVDM